MALYAIQKKSTTTTTLCHVVVIDQSDAGLQRLLRHPGFKLGIANPGLPLAKMQKVTLRLSREVTLQSQVR